MVRLLAVVVVLAWQLVVAVPAQARPGDLDRGFGGGGTVTTDFAGGPDDARALVVQGRKLVAAGLAFNSETSDDFGLARYSANGALDRSFGTGGKVTTNISGSISPDEANALIQQADGKLVAAGVAGQDFGLARYNPNGTLDASFGAGGTVTTDIAGDSDAAQALAVQADGKLVAAGGAGPGGDFALARYRTR